MKTYSPVEELGSCITDNGIHVDIVLARNVVELHTGKQAPVLVDADSLVGQVILNLVSTSMAPECKDCGVWDEEMYCRVCASDRYW